MLLLVGFGGVVSTTQAAQASLSAGDVAFVRLNADSPDGYSFVTLVAIGGGEQFYITESGWTGTGWQENSEPHFIYTAPSGGLAAGTVVHVVETSADVIAVTGGGGTLAFASGYSGFNIGPSDNLLAYTSSTGAAPAAPNFVGGISSDLNWGGVDQSGNQPSSFYEPITTWRIENPNAAGSWNTTSDSALPPGLTNGATAISVFPYPGYQVNVTPDLTLYGEQDNMRYKLTAPTTGTRTELLYALNNPANWDSNDTTQYSTAQTITSLTVAPDPATGVKLIGSPRTSLRAGDLVLETYTVPAGNDRVLIVSAGNSGSTDITGVSFGGTAMTQEAEQNDGTAVDSIWSLALGSSASATTGNITVTHSGAGNIQFIGAMAFSGANQSTPVIGALKQAGSANPQSLTVTSAVGDLVVDMMDVYRSAGAATVTPASTRGLTHYARSALSTGYGTYLMSFKRGAPSVTMDWNQNGTALIQIAFNVKQASAASPEIAVTGNSVDIADGDSTPSSTDHTDFGSQATFTGTVSRTFTITNSGLGALTLSGTPKVTVSGTNAADFTVTSQPSSPVAASGTTTFTVQFDPSASGVRTAALSIANDDSDENPFNFSIQGTGTGAASQTFDFESSTAGSDQPSVSQTVSGITITLTDNIGANAWSVLDAGGSLGSTAKLAYLNSENASTITVSFSGEIDLKSLVFFEAGGPSYVTTGANYVFTPTSGSGANSTVSVPYSSFTPAAGGSVGQYGTVNLNWSNVSAFTVTIDSSGGTPNPSSPGFDTIVFIPAAVASSPAITSATYDASTGALVITGSNLQAKSGAANDVVASKLTLTGEGGATYTLTDTADVEITSSTSVTVTLSATDRSALNQIFNKNGTTSTGATTYNLAATDDWNAAVTSGDTSDTTGNGITVSNVATPTVTTATYNATTGVLTVTGTNLLKRAGANNDIDVSKLTLSGDSTAYALTTTSVEITSGTSFSVTLNSTDQTALATRLNKNGTSSSAGVTYNLAAAEDWAAGAEAVVTIADLTGNGVTVSGDTVAPPVPSTPDLMAGSDTGGSNTDNITSDTTPTFSGTADTGTLVTIFVDMNTNDAFDNGTDTVIAIGNAVAGAYSLTPFSALTPGAYTVKAVASDGTNTSAASGSLMITIDTAAPASPAAVALASASDTGSSNSDRITNDTTPTITGTAEANATVTVTSSVAGLIGTTTADGSGSWSFTPGSALAANTHMFFILATDAAGNNSTANSSLTITIDTTAPVITSGATTSAAYRGLPAYTIVATGSATTFGGSGLPAGVTVNPSTGAFEGAATATGTFNATITASDAAGNTDSSALTVTISAKTITVSGISANAKTYDSTTTATLTTAGYSFGGVESGDTVTLDATGVTATFADEHVADGLAVTVSGLALSGAQGANYTLTQPTGLTAALTGSAALSGAISGDDLTLNSGSATGTFATANAGGGLTVTTSGYSLSGTDAVNYTLTQPTLAASITAKALTVTGITAANKAYDGTTGATLNTTGAVLVGIVGSDTVSADTASAAGAFADKTVAAGKTVTISGITLTGSAAGNYAVTQPTTTATITAAPLTVSGVTASDKTYDGATTATPAFGSASLTGVIGADTVTLTTSSATANFADAQVGSGKTVTLTGLTIGGTDAANYTLTQPTTTAAITPKNLTVTGLAASNKTYDATTTATLTGTATVVGKVGSDDVAANATGATGAFADKTVATGKAVTITGVTLSGTAAGNYTVSQPTGLTANITAASLTATGATAANKTYDATTTATPTTAGATPVGVLGADVVTINGGSATAAFADKNIGTGKTVTFAGLALAGADAGNYTLTQPTTTADITPATLTVTGTTVANKTYDGATTATPGFSSANLVTVLGSDTVTLNSGAASATFATATVGAAKIVTITGLTLTGADAGNYTLTQPTATASITAKTLTVTGVTAANKTYDATTAATLNVASAALSGIVGSDTVAVDTASAAGTFADAQVATGKLVTVTGISLTGSAAGNYTVTQPTTTASITTKALTVTGITAASKPFDKTTTATLDVTAAVLVGVIGSDDAVLDTTNAVGTFADQNIGEDKTVTVTGLALTGTAAGNYSITAPTTTANITKKELTVTGVTAANKTYDDTATATANVTAATLTGVETGDTVVLNTSLATATFADAFIGAGKTVTLAGLTISGADAGNYALIQPTTTADITAATITLTGLVAQDKTYDATTTVVIDSAGLALVGIQGDDTVTLNQAGATANFADKAVGAGKAVTLAGATLAGADAGNYTLVFPTTLTASITAKALTVTGTLVTTKVYDGTTAATLDFAGATLVGVQSTDTVTLDASVATGVFADADAGPGKAVTITGLTLGGADGGNYTLSAPTPTGTITPATVTYVLGNLSATYDGTGKAATVTATPTGIAATLTYNGSTTAPSAAGSYAVVASSANANYTGSANATLVIGQASQTLTFPSPGQVTVRTPVTLGATASSGLGVTYQVIAGEATLSGATLTINSAASAVGLRATQAGDNNYTAASADLTIGLGSITKLTQTITFPAIGEKRVNDGPFELTATASSGLTVSYTVVSGPAMLSGSTITMTGATGTVTIRADQAGNDVYAAAAAVSQSFEATQAGPLVYFGTASDGSSFAVNIPEGSTVGTLFGQVGNGQFYILTFQVNEDRTITALNLQLLGDPVGGAADLTANPLRTRQGKASQLSGATGAAELAFTFTGAIRNGQLAFTIAELGTTLTATVEPANGPTRPLAGLYESSSLNSANGTTTSIVGTTGKVYVLAITPNRITGGAGTIAADGSFALTTSDGVIIQGAVDPQSTSISGTLTLADGSQIAFAGLSTGTLRTDRLINLSTRAKVARAEGTGNLIAGFVIGGTSPKQVLIRGIGPGLAAYGVTDALADPRLRLFDASGTLLQENDNWGGTPALTAAMNRVGGFPLATDSPDAAILATLAPGPYTVHVINGGEAGVALAEIYDAAENPNSEYQRLINISSRGTVSGGDGVLIGGFIVTGNSPKRVLVRGVGPGLGAYGVDGTLVDPTLKLYSSAGTLIAQNDNWQTPVTVAGGQVAATAAEVSTSNTNTGAFQLAEASTDAAVVVTLAPGAYTAHVGSATAAPGTALIEIYEIP